MEQNNEVRIMSQAMPAVQVIIIAIGFAVGAPMVGAVASALLVGFVVFRG